MSEKQYHRRRGGSLVFPIILITLGVLFVLDNLNITPGIDWASLWKLWPIIIIAFGLEVLLGRRVSFGSVFLVVLIIIVVGAAVWWSVVGGSGERTTEHFTWPLNGVERAELQLDLGVGKLQLVAFVKKERRKRNVFSKSPVLLDKPGFTAVGAEMVQAPIAVVALPTTDGTLAHHPITFRESAHVGAQLHNFAAPFVTWN